MGDDVLCLMAILSYLKCLFWEKNKQNTQHIIIGQFVWFYLEPNIGSLWIQTIILPLSKSKAKNYIEDVILANVQLANSLANLCPAIEQNQSFNCLSLSNWINQESKTWLTNQPHIWYDLFLQVSKTTICIWIPWASSTSINIIIIFNINIGKIFQICNNYFSYLMKLIFKHHVVVLLFKASCCMSLKLEPKVET